LNFFFQIGSPAMSTATDPQSSSDSVASSNQGALKRTPLYEAHVALGGKVIPFAGWELPVQYRGLIEEHKVVRESVGVFDVSHMGELWLTGKDAARNLNALTCNDVSIVEVGQAQYTALLNDKGGVIDDLIIYRLGEHEFLLCVNASNSDGDFQWIKSHLTGDVTFVNRSHEFGLLALQGPRAHEIVKCDRELLPLLDLKPFRVARVQWRNIELIGARTGYTGEDGFELFVPWSETTRLWGYLVSECKVEPIGLGARDTLRLEAGYPLHGHELDVDHSALESGLAWIVKMEKGEFVGRTALQKRECVQELIPFKLNEPGIARHGDHIVDSTGEVLGVVTSGTRSPSLGISIGLARVVKGALLSKPGAGLSVSIRGRAVHGEVVKLPFYRRRRRASVSA
jgi:aminomethyltransferase